MIFSVLLFSYPSGVLSPHVWRTRLCRLYPCCTAAHTPGLLANGDSDPADAAILSQSPTVKDM
jgi:hypothetical protein